jgi:hypothetical protein
MVTRIAVVLALIAGMQSELAAQEKGEGVKAGDVIHIKMTGDLAKEYAVRMGTPPEVVAKNGLAVQTIVTVVERLPGGQLRIERHLPINSEGKPARLLTLTGTVDSTKVTTDITPKGTLVSRSPGELPVETTEEVTNLRLELTSLKGLRLRTWTLAEDIRG